MSNKNYANLANNVWKWPMLVILVLGATLAGGFIMYEQFRGPQSVRDFEDCVQAGNPVMESFPEQCTADGKTYINTKVRPESLTAPSD